MYVAVAVGVEGCGQTRYILEVESSGAIPRSRQAVSCCFRQDKVFMPDVGQHTGFLIENILLFSFFCVWLIHMLA